MTKERLYILVYIKDNKILIKNVKNINDFDFSENELFIYVREELFFGDNGISELSDYYDIPNLDSLLEEDLKKVFYTPYIIECNYSSFMRNIQDVDLYRDLDDLYNFISKDSSVMSLEEYKINHYKEEL